MTDTQCYLSVPFFARMDAIDGPTGTVSLNGRANTGKKLEALYGAGKVVLEHE